MSNINGMFDALESLPARGTIAEMHRAARNLVTTGRRVGASDTQTRELLDMCGLTGELERIVRVIDTRTTPTWRPQCGTPAGYMAHHRAGERYCEDCRAANARKKAEQRAHAHDESEGAE